MAQVLFNSDSTPSQADLDANFTELYGKTAWATTGIGYATGAGGTVTQATNKSTTVTLNKTTGRVTMNAASLAAGATVAFDVNNSLVGSDDTVVATTSGTLWGNYSLEAYNARSGGFTVRLTNRSGGALAEAVTFNFTVIKGATS